MNDVNKNLRAFHLSIDELLKALAHSEDVNRTVAHTSFVAINPISGLANHTDRKLYGFVEETL